MWIFARISMQLAVACAQEKFYAAAIWPGHRERIACTLRAFIWAGAHNKASRKRKTIIVAIGTITDFIGIIHWLLPFIDAMMPGPLEADSGEPHYTANKLREAERSSAKKVTIGSKLMCAAGPTKSRLANIQSPFKRQSFAGPRMQFAGTLLPAEKCTQQCLHTCGPAVRS